MSGGVQGLLHLAAPSVLGCLILGIEVTRYRRGRPFDALRLASGIYFLAYTVVPLQIQFADLTDFRGGSWSWAVQFEPEDPRFIYGSILGLLGYLGLLTGYMVCHQIFPDDPPPSSLGSDEVGSSRLLRAAIILIALGGAALAVYTASIGGIVPLLFQAAAFRSAPPVITQWAFLKNVAPVMVSGTFILAGLHAARRTRSHSRWLGWLLGAAWLLSFLLLFHRAARLPIIAFLVTLPLARAIRRGRVDPMLIAGGTVAFLFLVLFGKAAFTAGSRSGVLGDQLSVLRDDAQYAINSVLLEFSFPFITASNAVATVPEITPYRWFSDVGIAVLYLVPQRISGVTPPLTVSMVNSQNLQGGGVPVDVTSLGYYSAGVPGVAIATFLFGAYLFTVDRVIRRFLGRGSPLLVLGISVLFYSGFTVMYGDPQLVLESGFPLLVSLSVVVGALHIPRFVAWLSSPRTHPVASDAKQ